MSELQGRSLVSFPCISSMILMLIMGVASDQMISRGVSTRLVRAVLPAVGAPLCGLSLIGIGVVG